MWIDDQIIANCDLPVAIRCWVPDQLSVVLGASNLAEVEVNTAACEADQVPVLKRYGGGGTVVLHSGCAVISLGCWVAQHFQNRKYFDLVNRAVMTTLGEAWPALSPLRQDGVSDLTIGEAKVAGTSLFRSRNYLLYQASILVDSGVQWIERYLKHPSREPEYRRNRPHRSFLCGLNEHVSGLSPAACAAVLAQRLPASLAQSLGAELIDSRPEQWDGLRRRAGR